MEVVTDSLVTGRPPGLDCCEGQPKALQVFGDIRALKVKICEISTAK